MNMTQNSLTSFRPTTRVMVPPKSSFSDNSSTWTSMPKSTPGTLTLMPPIGSPTTSFRTGLSSRGRCSLGLMDQGKPRTRRSSMFPIYQSLSTGWSKELSAQSRTRGGVGLAGLSPPSVPWRERISSRLGSLSSSLSSSALIASLKTRDVMVDGKRTASSTQWEMR